MAIESMTLSNHLILPWRRKCTPVVLLGEPHEQYEKAKRLESVIIITLIITQLYVRNQEEGIEED